VRTQSSSGKAVFFIPHVAKYELDVIAPIRSANKMILALTKAKE
jgi:hypothetical protein